MDTDRLKAFLSDPNVPKEAKQRAVELYRAGQAGTSSTTTTQTTRPGLGTTAAEVVGGGLGRAGGAALGTAIEPGIGTYVGGTTGAGLGTAGGGAIADYFAGRPIRAMPSLERFGSGALFEGVGGPVLRKVGEGVGAGVRAIGERFPRVGRVIEAVKPGTVAKPLAREVTEDLPGQALERVHIGVRGQSGLQQALRTFQAEQEPIFRGIESAAGEAPVVPTTGLHEFAGESAQYWAGRLNSLDPQRRTGDVLLRALESDAITFRDARLLESGLGKLSRTRQPIGTVVQHEAGDLLRGVKTGMEAFLESPAGEDIAPTLAAAKQQYRLGKQLFNETPVGKLIKTQPEKVLDQVFRPGNVTNTIDFRETVPPDVWEDAVRTWSEQLYQKFERPGGGFDGTGFAKEIQKYIRTDHLQHIITDPAQRAEWEKAASTLGKMGEPGLLNSAVVRRILYPALGFGVAQYEYGRGGEDLNVRNHPYMVGGTLGALSLLNPQMRRLYGSLLPQAAGQAGLQYLGEKSPF